MKRFSAKLSTMIMLPLAAGCGGSGAQPAPEPAHNDTAELEALFQARQDSARMRFTPADVDFMTGMIAHHAQALVMSDLARANGAGPQIQTLAARIINAQRDEIRLMQRWLEDRSRPVPEIHIHGIDLMIEGVEDHHMHMPGMLTDEQLRELAAARGEDFDRLFLTYMIEHHQGAVTMVRELFASDGAAQDETAFRLASDIQVDQITEIARMKAMLEAMGGAADGR